MHSRGSGISILKRGWTLFYAGVVPGERRGAGEGLLIAPWFSANVLDFTPVDERDVSLCLQVEECVLTVVYAYVPTGSSEYLSFL